VFAIAASGLVLSQPEASALENGLLRTPPMGFNNWNTTGCDINEQVVAGINGGVSHVHEEAGLEEAVAAAVGDDGAE